MKFYINNEKEFRRALSNDCLIEEIYLNHTELAFKHGLALKQTKGGYNYDNRKRVGKETTTGMGTDIKVNDIPKTDELIAIINGILYQYETSDNNRNGLADFAKTFKGYK